MEQLRTSAWRGAGYALLVIGLAWLAWVCFAGFALRDGIAEQAGVTSAWSIAMAFVVDAWHMLFLGLIASLAGIFILWHAARPT